MVTHGTMKQIKRHMYRNTALSSVKSASLATEEILYGVRARLVWDESETVSSFNRWSFFLGRGTLQDVYREWPTSRFWAV